MPDFGGIWGNGAGSEMILSVTDGAVTGTYRTGLGKPDAEEVFPLTGFVNGELITFAVNFGDHGSLTTWMGQMTGDEIKTLWHLGRQTDDQGTAIEPWARVLAGATTFQKQP